MQDNLLNAFTEQTKSLYVPFAKINELLIANMERMTEFQLKAIQSYAQIGFAQIGFGQMRKAVEVKDMETLQSLPPSQAEVMGTVNKR